MYIIGQEVRSMGYACKKYGISSMKKTITSKKVWDKQYVLISMKYAIISMG